MPPSTQGGDAALRALSRLGSSTCGTHRVKGVCEETGATRWVEADDDAACEGRIADSRVHRYSRDRGFRRGDQEMVDEDPESRAANDTLHSGKKGPISHETRVNRFGLFERYVLERHSGMPYANWLQRVAYQVGSDKERELLDGG